MRVELKFTGVDGKVTTKEMNSGRLRHSDGTKLSDNNGKPIYFISEFDEVVTLDYNMATKDGE